MLSLMAAAVVGMGLENDGEAARRSRSRSSRRRRRRSRAGVPAGLYERGTTDCVFRKIPDSDFTKSRTGISLNTGQ